METHLNETCMITFVVVAKFVFTAAILNYQRGLLDLSPPVGIDWNQVISGKCSGKLFGKLGLVRAD